MVEKMINNYLWIRKILKIKNVKENILTRGNNLHFADKNGNNLYYDFYTFLIR